MSIAAIVAERIVNVTQILSWQLQLPQVACGLATLVILSEEVHFMTFEMPDFKIVSCYVDLVEYD